MIIVRDPGEQYTVGQCQGKSTTAVFNIEHIVVYIKDYGNIGLSTAFFGTKDVDLGDGRRLHYLCVIVPIQLTRFPVKAQNLHTAEQCLVIFLYKTNDLGRVKSLLGCHCDQMVSTRRLQLQAIGRKAVGADSERKICEIPGGKAQNPFFLILRSVRCRKAPGNKDLIAADKLSVEADPGRLAISLAVRAVILIFEGDGIGSDLPNHFPAVQIHERNAAVCQYAAGRIIDEANGNDTGVLISAGNAYTPVSIVFPEIIAVQITAPPCDDGIIVLQNKPEKDGCSKCDITCERRTEGHMGAAGSPDDRLSDSVQLKQEFRQRDKDDHREGTEGYHPKHHRPEGRKDLLCESPHIPDDQRKTLLLSMESREIQGSKKQISYLI